MASKPITLRLATLDDVPTLAAWDREPHVIAATTDDPAATKAFDEDHDWPTELRAQNEHARYFIAELDGRPIGAMEIVDPLREPSHYWGDDVEPNLRAIDIWIGNASDLGRGHGEAMMRLALERCFAEPAVTAVVIDPLASNERVHRFYRRLGFREVGRRCFGEDDCLVMRLEREGWKG